MHSAHPELTAALGLMLDKLDTSIRESGYTGEPVKMYAADGIAVHYFCGTRYTADVDATFSHRILMPFSDLVVKYQRDDGRSASLYLDPTYNDHFALLHPDHRDSAVEWDGIGNERRVVKLLALSPVDLAVSKVSRFSEQDHEDILALASRRYFSAGQLRQRAEEALDYYVGDTRWIRGTIDQLCSEITALN